MLVAASILVMAVAISRAHEGHDLGITVRMPLVLTPGARAGKELFEAKCAACHGRNVEGTHTGPSLIPYDRAHHPDGNFFEAMKSGVRQHHWNFGDMPPVNDLTEEEIRNIITYVRDLQAYNSDPDNDR